MTFSPIFSGTGVAGYDFLARTRVTQQALLAQSAEVLRETEGFAEDIKNVQSAEQLVEDRQLLKVALGAFGLLDDLENKAFIQKVLESDMSDSDSFANRLTDTRYQALAQAFDFAGQGTPTLSQSGDVDEVLAQLGALETPDELLANSRLLRATLQRFGLEDDASNTFFLQKVLESDVTDPNSFASRLSNPAYAELAETFDFAEKSKLQDSFYGFAAEFGEAIGALETAEDLLANEDLLTASLKMFELERDADRTGFLTSILNSDLSDPASYANQLDDPRYAAFSEAFGFGEPVLLDDEGVEIDQGPSKAQEFVDLINERDTVIKTPTDFFNDPALMLATFNFFDLPQGSDAVPFAGRILESDPDSPTSLVNVFPDTRYKVFFNAFDFETAQSERSYSAEFINGVVDNYLDNQFEVRVGEGDTSMRLALSLDRDLNDVVSNGLSNDSRWFAVMGSSTLREVFQTTLNFPSSFATLDIDQQLRDFKERSESVLGTSDLSDLTTPDAIDDLRQRYLLQSSLVNSGVSSSQNIVLSLISR
ncbi:DUF1217 domain-containing protein [Algirhabdus cladophorae]|uniref:DUF1217 domain-containing protein n=1 Tax=Algirhabdus cladophorae TaxID=3377108 RepID=UPI003B8464E5